VLSPRKLAAIDIAFLGARLIIAEYAIGVLLFVALEALTLLRGGSHWQVAVGVYLILLGINYVPMLVYAVAISKGGSAHAEIHDELTDKRRAMTRYRRQSAFLLVPLVVPITALRQGGWKARG
jgi:hypothetical protein